MNARVNVLENALQSDVHAKKLPRNVQQHVDVKRMFARTNKHAQEQQFMAL